MAAAVHPGTDDEMVSMIRDSASRFLGAEYAGLFDRHAAEPAAVWQSFADLGWLALPVSSGAGGLGGGLAELCALFEQFGRHHAVHPYLHAVMAARLFEGIADQSQRHAGLAGLMAGTLRTVFASSEAGVRAAFAALQTSVSMEEDAAVVRGVKRDVLFHRSATHFLVTASVGSAGTDDVAICRIAADAAGIRVAGVDRIDGCPSADIHFDSVPAEILCMGRPAHELLDKIEAIALVLSMAEVVGAMRQLLELTCDYLGSREQFGRKLGALQALRMRIVDMHLETELAAACLARAAAQLDTAAEGDIALAALAAKSLIGRAGRRVAQEAVQLHGAIGFTEEALPGRYLKRIEALLAASRPAAACVQQYMQRRLSGEPIPPITGVFDHDDLAFAAQVRSFVAAELSPDIEHKVRCGFPLGKSDYVRWQKALHARQWIAGSWPREYGGADWTPARQYLFQSESGRQNAPDVMPYGVKMVGPVLYTFGTPEQQAEHLPSVLSSDIWWCQGYSEPNAGSDLASLRTRAQRIGDHYVVNGTKIWTTQAHYADWMHCLVRTGDSKDRHRTITLLLMDMNAEGVSVRPIESIDGLHHLNQVFFDNVRVPVNQRVGEEGDGWKIANFLLAHERTALAKVAHKERILRRLRELLVCRADSLEESGEYAVVAERLAALEIRLHALEYLELRYLADSAGPRAGIHGSALKILATELQQALTELAMDVLGPDAARYCIGRLNPDDAAADPAAAADAVGVYEYLYNRAASIYGGTNEIQRTIIARALLPEC